MTSPSVDALVDHDEIRQWAEERHAAPARVMPSADHPDADELTFSFRQNRDGGGVELLDWEEWLSRFDDEGLSLLVLDRERTGLRSRYFRLVPREDLPSDMAGGDGPPAPRPGH